MSRISCAVLILSMLLLVGCGGKAPPPADQTQQPAAEPQQTPVFEDDFETGEAEEWSGETDQGEQPPEDAGQDQ